jgi:hypothetical protein
VSQRTRDWFLAHLRRDAGAGRQAGREPGPPWLCRDPRLRRPAPSSRCGPPCPSGRESADSDRRPYPSPSALTKG